MSYTNGLDKPSDYFNTVLYTGNGSTQSITGVNFQPDLSWIKSRTTADTHAWYDAVRGATKRIKSNSFDAETTQSTALTSFDSDGFSIGAGGDVNTNSANYVSWNWLASNTTASNTDGSITSTVSANTTSGFSIVSYTGTGSLATVGHGLGATPKMIIFKVRTEADPWNVYHKSITADNYLILNDTSASLGSFTRFNDTDPTSSVFTVNTAGTVNPSGITMIAYCFAEKKGFSKFGSYTGNGNADGVFVYLGFKPAFIMIKKSSGTENWSMYDTKRNINGTTNTLPLNADNTSIEPDNVGKNMDILSNGVKMYTSNGELNLSGETYIYMAFAENPFVTSTGIPTCAR